MKRSLILSSALALSLMAAPAFAFGGHRGDGNCPMGQGGPGMMMNQQGQTIDRQLTVDDVKTLISAKLIMMGNKRLKLGKVTEKDADTIVAEIVTVDNSLVHSMEYNRHTGRHQRGF